MKLKNKRTGEVKEVIVGGYPVSGKTKMWECSEVDANEETGYKSLGMYTSLAELNAEWEDYEEPKGYWYINEFGTPTEMTHTRENIYDKQRKNFGNYFETEEEAEKAVEKLKAWKRLKDKGFRFIDHIDRDAGQGMTRYEWDGYVNGEDLDLLFGGEE